MRITNNQEQLKSLRTAGLIFKPEATDLKDTYLELINIFNSKGIRTIVEANSAKIIDQDGIEFKELCEQSDFLVSIGGDGTLISVCRRSLQTNKPILGINLGTLGFLTDIMPDEIDNFLDNMINGYYRIDQRMMLEFTINNNTHFAFNDIVLTRTTIESMASIDTIIDEKVFNSYYGDGLIISTPTGSTAYNLSCGGPVVYPLAEAIVVTPISAHSLTQRPIVLPKDFDISCISSNDKDLAVIIDGQDKYELKSGDKISIKVASSKAKLIHRDERNYFDILNKKLNWGNKTQS